MMRPGYDVINEKIETAAKIFYEKNDVTARNELMIFLYDEKLQKYFFKRYKYETLYNISVDDFSGIYIDAMLDIIKSYSPEKSDKFLPYFWKYMGKKIQTRSEENKSYIQELVDKKEKAKKRREKEKEKREKAQEAIAEAGKDEIDVNGNLLSQSEDNMQNDSDTNKEYEKFLSFLNGEIKDGIDVTDDIYTTVNLYMAIVSRLNMMRSVDDEEARSVGGKEDRSFRHLSRVHTDSTTKFIKDSSFEIIPLIEKHHDEVYKSMDCDFMDYFTVDKCTTLYKLSDTELKNLKEITGEDKTDKECKLPLPAKVYIKYYQLKEGITIDKSTISRYKSSYKDMVSVIMKKELPYG